MRKKQLILFLLLLSNSIAYAQRERDNAPWTERKLPEKSRGIPEISPWHTGTAGVIKNEDAEFSLFNPSRIGFTEKTELLVRIAKEFILPNIGLKHRWWKNKRFCLSTEHTFYYTWPLLKILQSSGWENLLPDTVAIGHGLAARNEILFSWLIHPREFGNPFFRAEKVLTLRAGVECYIGQEVDITPFDKWHALYHSYIFDKKALYYGGFQFDSYFSEKIHYSVNALYYNTGFSSLYALEGNARLTYYLTRKIGISAACKAAYTNILAGEEVRFLPFLDLTYRITSDRRGIEHGLFKRRRR